MDGELRKARRKKLCAMLVFLFFLVLVVAFVIIARLILMCAAGTAMCGRRAARSLIFCVTTMVLRRVNRILSGAKEVSTMQQEWRPGMPVRRCEVCGEWVSDAAMRWAALYVNGQMMFLSTQVHVGPDGSALHPESLSGVGGPGVGANDVWEWRLEG